MPTPLTIVAQIQALPGFEKDVEKVLLEVIPPTLAESGCLQYDLHRDLEIPGRFLFFENWKTREDWLQHMETAHLDELKRATAGKAAETIIFQMEKIPGS